MQDDQELVAALGRCGEVSDAATLIRLTSRTELKHATMRGLIIKDARGRYALPTAEVGRRKANQLSGVISHTSAAAHWGWEMKVVPARPTTRPAIDRRVHHRRQRQPCGRARVMCGRRESCQPVRVRFACYLVGRTGPATRSTSRDPQEGTPGGPA